MYAGAAPKHPFTPTTLPGTPPPLLPPGSSRPDTCDTTCRHILVTLRVFRVVADFSRVAVRHYFLQGVEGWSHPRGSERRGRGAEEGERRKNTQWRKSNVNFLYEVRNNYVAGSINCNFLDARDMKVGGKWCREAR